ncbi:hypothetical protein IAR55_000362 [Kwoniella newhampshirensis]|uniref:Aminotransferase class I/classII domain-containing protein n=1 Tax=Kwoniella newhampshirensis TaxID=1651941 RepID=A0AAW0Z6L4_9TREE
MDSAYAIPSQTRETVTSLPKAKDMTHHLNQVTKNRQASSLKELYKYMTYPGMSIMSWLFPATSQNSSFTIPKYVSGPPNPAAIQLSTSLQYQSATGPPALPLFLREYVEKVYKPAYADWDVLINVGATDGWSKIVQLLLEYGDAILVEEWTYPGAENTFLPYEIERVAVKMDAEGMLPEHLESVLRGWDEEKRGKRRPHVMYTIPTGQNPTDVIICEDEPYYCLYTGEWTPKGSASERSVVAQRLADAEKEEGSEGNEAFIKALPPSFLAFDVDGRVIRMDVSVGNLNDADSQTFSKTSTPGSRLGWITTSPLFIERLTRATEAGTQAPSGFATALTTTMLQQYGFDGYIRWLRGIKALYNMRKTWLCDALADEFHLEFNSRSTLFPERSQTITGYAKRASSAWDEKRGLKGPALLTFIPPTDNLVLFAPGWGFDAGGEHAIGGNGYGYYRLAFSIATYEEVRVAMGTFSKVLTKFFRV